MVLRSSQVGQRFPISTATEYISRIDKYEKFGRRLGVEEITPRSVTFTLIEHIIDKDRHSEHGYELIENLLQEYPDSYSITLSILVRARFVLVTESLKSDSQAFKEYAEALYSDLPDPLPEDGRSARELLHDANDRSFADPKKIELVQASLSREGTEEVLQEFLYLSFRDIVERYRHESRNDPWRGELWLGIKQANCLRNAFSENLSRERMARIKSYQQVALGEVKSGGRWRSLKDFQDQPDPNFLDASKHFLKAAEDIHSVDETRYVKYLSKSFQHLANASRHQFGFDQGWVMSQQYHETAIDVISAIVTDDTEDNLAQTITEALALHKFKSHEAEAVVAFERGHPDNIIDHVDAAWDLINGGVLPVYVETDVLETAKELAEVLQLERSGQLNEAVKRYKEVDSPKFDVKKRKNLTEIKQNLIDRNHESAIEIATELFGDNSKSQ